MKKVEKEMEGRQAKIWKVKKHRSEKQEHIHNTSHFHSALKDESLRNRDLLPIGLIVKWTAKPKDIPTLRPVDSVTRDSRDTIAPSM